MTAQELLENLKKRGITLRVEGNNITANGILTEDIVKQIRFYKTGLLKALQSQPFMVIDYERDRLCGQLPAHYTDLDNGRIRAIYRNRQELREHVLLAFWAKEEFEQAKDMLEACKALGGSDEPIQPKEQLFDLYDHDLDFWMRGYPLARLVDVAMQSAIGDKLELKLTTRLLP